MVSKSNVSVRHAAHLPYQHLHRAQLVVHSLWEDHLRDPRNFSGVVEVGMQGNRLSR